MGTSYDDIAQRMSLEHASSALLTAPVAPDAAARANRVAAATGLPPETVDRNLTLLDQQVQVARAQAVMQREPSIAAWASNPRHAAVGADDMDGLAANARYWRGATTGSIRAAEPPAPGLGSVLSGLATSFVEGAREVRSGLQSLASDWLPDLLPRPAPGVPRLGDYGQQNAQRDYLRSEARVDAATPQFKSALARGLYGGASSLAQMAPSVALAVATGQPGIGLAVGAAQQGLPAYTKYRARGGTRAQAALGAGLEGGIEAGTEYLPMGFLVNRLGKAGAGHFITGFLGRELPGELAATLGQNAVDTAIANPDKTWGDYLREQPDQLVQTAIGTLVSGGFFAGVHHVAGRYAGQEAAISDADALGKAMDAASSSKTRARDPDAFQRFIEQHTTGTGIEHMFVPAQAVASYFQSHDLDYHSDDFWGDYASQVDEGLHTGGDVVVPTAAAAAHLSGTPTWEAIKADVRTSPGGMSLSEAESLRKSHDEAMERIGAETAEELARTRAAEEPRNRIYHDIRDKLTSAGYTQDAAHTNAELVAQRYATRAERLGQALTGDETQRIGVNAVLPEALAPLVAKDSSDVALQGLVNVMRGASGWKKLGPSLLDWIGQQGGIEDKGGDLRAMGLASIRGVSRKGERKLIREPLAQGDMLGGGEQQNANTPDELAARAQEAGYFPAGDRPSVNDLFSAIEREVRGEPIHIGGQGQGGDGDSDAANQLRGLLTDAGYDPDTATIAQVKATINSYRAAQEGGLRQTYGDNPRGQITFTDAGSIIDLFQSRNTSTFAHEMGHQWLEELREDAHADGAGEQLKADWGAVADWFKANGHPLGEDGAIPVDAHELWARGVERYLLEGKAPSLLLRRVLDTFRAWLLNVYQVVANLRSPITPEIREVMDRLLATDQEIAETRERQAVSDLFDTAADAGMSGEEFAAYKRLATNARDEAHSALLYKTMATIRAQRTRAWNDEAARVRDEVTASVNQRAEFKALHYLRTGLMLDDPEAPREKVRLSREWLVDQYGEGILAQLPKSVPPIYADTNTASADDVAERVGFRSGDEMVRTLIAMEERRQELLAGDDKRSVRAALIDAETEQEMRDRHGDPLNDGSIEEEALAAVQNDAQGEKMAFELRALSRRSARQPTPYSLAKQWAAERIAQGTVQESTSGSAIQRYARAAAKAGKAAEQAMVSRDYDEAFRQKQAQMLNNALVAEAGRARDAVTAARDRLAVYARRRTIKSMDQDYLEQIHALLEQVEFRQQSQTQVDRRVSFEDWARAREAEGHDVVVPTSFAASLGTTHWSRLTVEKLLGLDDTAKQIAHLGRFKQQLIDGAEQRAHDEIVGEAVGNIGNLPPRKPVEFDPAWSDRMKAKVESFDASLLKMETIVDWLDGGNSGGVFNRIVFQPISAAQAREQDMTADYLGRVREAMGAVPNIRRWMDRVTIPELMDRETGQPLTLTRQRLVSMALNMGNEGNIQRLTDGYGWNRETVMSVLNRELSTDDWQFVQRIWDTIDGLWPEIAAMERRVNGVEPDKVEAVPIETAAGTLRGGYFPAVYDTTRDLKTERHAESAADLLETTYTKATTRASSTKDRLDKVKRPILLDLGVINRHLGEVIHDITHREPIINASKFLNDSRVQKAVNETLGPEIRKQFQPWLKFVANQWAVERAGNEGVGAFMNKLRANTTAVGMGFRLSTVIAQVAGYSNTIEVVGMKHLGPAIARVAQAPVESHRFVMDRSGEYRHRMDTIDRDIDTAIRSIDQNRTALEKLGGVIPGAMKFMYHGIGYSDRAVSLPTWLAGYNRALAEGKDEAAAIYEGDKAIRQSQGSGGAKDLAPVQRGTGQYGKLLQFSTMFYSYFSAMYQRERNLGRDLGEAVREKRPRDLPALLARAWWLLVVPPVLSDLIVGRGPDDDEDWGEWAFKKMLTNLLAPIPFVRELAEPAWDALAGNRVFGYQLSPVQRAGDAIVNVAKDAHHLVHGQPNTHPVRDALEVAGYASGLVPGQLASATQFLVDVGEGTQDPDGLKEWYKGLTTGHAKPAH